MNILLYSYYPDCDKILSSSLETIYSPDYPNSSPLTKTCSWQINAKPGKYVAIQLMEMNVGGSDWDCRMGYLEIYDGCGAEQFLVDKICTSRYQNDQRYLWVSTGPCVVIKFNSAHGNTNKFYLKTRQTSCEYKRNIFKIKKNPELLSSQYYFLL